MVSSAKNHPDSIPSNTAGARIDWYERRHELWPDMIFTTHAGDKVKLDRSVPGDGTRWYVANWSDGSWAFYDDTIEPGDLAEYLGKDR